MSYGYGARQNPFDQRDGGGNAGYGGGLPAGPRAGGNRYNEGAPMAHDEYSSNNVEMASLAQNASSFGQGDPNAILNECADIDRGINTIDQNLNQMKMLQQRALDDADSSASSSTNRQLDTLSSETMAHYRSLTERVRTVKSNPESQQPKNAPQVGRVDRRLKQAIQSYQQVESQFRKKTQEQMARQYRIVRPDADDSEVQAAVEDPNGTQVFQQALMQSNRRGQAQSVLNAVRDRHAQLEKIEQQMIELAQLFQDMDTLVVQQEVAVANIEQKAEETVENFDKGNEEIAVAVNTARKTRKKKWICLGIIVAVILVIVIIVVVYIMINKKADSSTTTNTTNTKRWLSDTPSNAARSWNQGNDVPELLTKRSESESDFEKRYIKLFRGETAKVGRSVEESEKRWVASAEYIPDDGSAKKRWVDGGAGANHQPVSRSLRLPGGRRAFAPGQAMVPDAI